MDLQIIACKPLATSQKPFKKKKNPKPNRPNSIPPDLCPKYTETFLFMNLMKNGLKVIVVLD